MTMPSDPQAVLARRPPSVEQYDELARALAESEKRVEVLRKALGLIVSEGERYSTEDTWGVYPIGLFEAVQVARAALSEPETPR